MTPTVGRKDAHSWLIFLRYSDDARGTPPPAAPAPADTRPDDGRPALAGLGRVAADDPARPRGAEPGRRTRVLDPRSWRRLGATARVPHPADRADAVRGDVGVRRRDRTCARRPRPG